MKKHIALASFGLLALISYAACGDNKSSDKKTTCVFDCGALPKGDQQVKMEVPLENEGIVKVVEDQAVNLNSARSVISLAPSLAPAPLFSVPVSTSGTLVDEDCYWTDGCSKNVNPWINGAGTLVTFYTNKAIGVYYTVNVLVNYAPRLDSNSANVNGGPYTPLTTNCVWPAGNGNYRWPYKAFDVELDNNLPASIFNLLGSNNGNCGYDYVRAEFDIANTVADPITSATPVQSQDSYHWRQFVSLPPTHLPQSGNQPVFWLNTTTTPTSKLDVISTVPVSTTTTATNFAFWYRPTLDLTSPIAQRVVARNVTLKVFSKTGAFICQRTLVHIIDLDPAVGSTYYAYQIDGISPNPAICVIQGPDNRGVTIGAP